MPPSFREPPMSEQEKERRARPHLSWCVGFEDAPSKYFWDEQEVSEREYTEATGKDPC
jgi:hypothetical protein